MIYLGAVENRARPGDIGDCEAILGEGTQDSTRIVEESEGLIAAVGDGCGDLQVLQSIGVGIGGRGLDGQAETATTEAARAKRVVRKEEGIVM